MSHEDALAPHSDWVSVVIALGSLGQWVVAQHFGPAAFWSWIVWPSFLFSF